MSSESRNGCSALPRRFVHSFLWCYSNFFFRVSNYANIWDTQLELLQRNWVNWHFIGCEVRDHHKGAWKSGNLQIYKWKKLIIWNFLSKYDVQQWKIMMKFLLKNCLLWRESFSVTALSIAIKLCCWVEIDRSLKLLKCCAFHSKTSTFQLFELTFIHVRVMTWKSIHIIRTSLTGIFQRDEMSSSFGASKNQQQHKLKFAHMR